MASHHHSCCRWLVASRCPCKPAQPTLDMFIVPAHLVTEDIIFRTKPPLAPLCLMVGPNSRVVCEFDPSIMTVVEDVSDQFANCDECCDPPPAQACCLPDGSCLDLPPAECKALGGTPQGKGTECVDTDCISACPNADECADCSPTILIEASGFSFTACFDGNLEDCPGNCVQTGPISIARTANKVGQLCNWDIPGPDFDLHPNCRGQTSIAFWPSGVHIRCIGNRWRVLVKMALLPGAPVVVDFLYETPNQNNCPFGEYTLSDIDAGAQSGWTVISTGPGSVVLS